MGALNKNSDPYSLDLARFQEVLGGAQRAADIIRGETYDLTSPIELTPRAALVLEIELP